MLKRTKVRKRLGICTYGPIFKSNLLVSHSDFIARRPV